MIESKTVHEPTLDDVLKDPARCDRIEARSATLHDDTAAILRERPGDEMQIVLAWLARLDGRLTEAEDRVLVELIGRHNRQQDQILELEARRLSHERRINCHADTLVKLSAANVMAERKPRLQFGPPPSIPPRKADPAPYLTGEGRHREAIVPLPEGRRLEGAEDAWPVVVEVLRERLRQVTKWGEQNHPALPTTVSDTRSAIRELGIPAAEEVRREYAADVEAGDTNWARILLEEFAEAIEEAGKLREGAPEASVAALREEVVQVAGVAVAWVESIDRAAAKGEVSR